MPAWLAALGWPLGPSAGSADVLAYFSDPIYEGQVCTGGTYNCPFATGNPSGGAGVFNVSNVLPVNLVLGAAGTLTIYGQGFNALLSPIAQFDSTSGITTGTPTVSPDGTTMTVTYQVTCSALLGTYNLTIGDAVDGGISGTTWPETVILPAAPAATIKLGGNSVSGTQSVVVGQQIALSSSVSLPSCMSISGQRWSTPPGTAVGGYAVSSTSGSVTALPANTNSTYTFYWVSPGSSYNMTYQYTMSGGGGSVSSPVTSSTFNVAGPSGTVTPGTGKVEIVGNTSVGFDPSSDIGIDFDATVVSPSGYSGTLEWEQLVTGFSAVYKSPKVTTTCTFPFYGSDGNFPYGTQNPANDSPSDQLADPKGNPNTETIVSGAFQMFLLWTPSGVASPIPVPIGSVTWNWNGDAVLNATTKKWSLKSGASISAGQFSPSTTYPSWQNVLTKSDVTCN